MFWVLFLVKSFRKGGLHHETLVVLLIAVAVILMAVPFMGQVGKKAEPAVNDDVCRASVEAKSKFKTDTFGSPLQLNCPEGESVSKARTKSQVNLDLATEMHRCWYKYGEGKRDWYDGWDFGSTELHCKICSRISYPKIKNPPTFGEFNAYLNEKELPGQDVTFADYFMGGENAIIQFGGPGTGIGPDEVMDLSKSVYVVYTIAKFDEDRIEELKEVYSKYTDDVAYGVGGIPDQVGGSIDGDVAIGAGAMAAGTASILLASFTLSTPIGWAVLIGGAAYTIFHEGDADVPYYSLALFSAEDITGVCDNIG